MIIIHGTGQRDLIQEENLEDRGVVVVGRRKRLKRRRKEKDVKKREEDRPERKLEKKQIMHRRNRETVCTNDVRYSINYFNCSYN